MMENKTVNTLVRIFKWCVILYAFLFILGLFSSCSGVAPASTGSCSKPGHEISIMEYWQKKKAKKANAKKRELRKTVENSKPTACYGYFAKPFITINHE